MHKPKRRTRRFLEENTALTLSVYDAPIHALGCKCDACKAALEQFKAYRSRKKPKKDSGTSAQ